METYDYEVIYFGIDDGAAAYTEAIQREATANFDQAKSEAEGLADALLSASDNLRSIEKALESDTRLLKAARAACKPPLTKDKLGGMAGVRPYRIKEMEEGFEGGYSRVQRRRVSGDLGILSELTTRFIDTTLAPWLASKCEPSPEQRRAWVSTVADRLACQADLWGARSRIGSMVEVEVEDWLRSHGYCEWPPRDGRGQRPRAAEACPVESEMGAGHYQKAAGRRAADAPDFLICPESGGKPVALNCHLCADQANSLRNADKWAGAALKAAEAEGAVPAIAIAGLIDPAFIAKMEDKGVAVVWLHDLGELGRLGI